MSNERLGIVERGQQAFARYGHHQRAPWAKDLAQIVQRRTAAQIAKQVDGIVERQVAQQMAEVYAALRRRDGKIDLHLIMQTAADITNTDIKALTSERRSRSVAWPRHFAYALVRDVRPDLSLPAIGKLFGKRDHTTVLHGVRKAAKLRDSAPFRQWFADPRGKALRQAARGESTATPFQNPEVAALLAKALA